jgi:hypothetical protein
VIVEWIALDTAQHCSYTFMVNVSKKIVCIITMYERAPEKKSTLLEKE